MADENNDYGYLLNVDYNKIDETIDKLNEEIKRLKNELDYLKNNEVENIDRIRKEVDYEVSVFQCCKIIEKLNQRKEQARDMHDMYIENFGGLDEIGGRGSRN
jgi:restriction endonuclease S subunit